MRRPRVAGVALLLAALAWGCSDATPTPETPETHGSPLPAMKGIREKIRAAPGRTGILTEKSRYSVFDEEVIIRDFFQDRREGFFLDVGCAWAVKGSNTYYLEHHLGWSGIGIDALDLYASEWAERRPRSKFFRFLVTDHSGSDESFYTSEKRPGISSTREALAAGRPFGQNEETRALKVPAITLDALLEQEGVERVDLVSMDIEGHEAHALAGFDIERYRPALVVVEGRDPRVLRYFREHGYAPIERYKPFDLVNTYFAPADARSP